MRGIPDNKLLLRLDPGLADHPPVAGVFRGDEFGECFRTHSAGLGSLLGEKPLHLVQFIDAPHFRGEPLHDRS